MFSARLEDIYPIEVDEETVEAIADWHYWVDMGYEF
ncbi:MAG: calcium-binding protein [Calothrix sp. MO_167.B12]|nr:calcium-binding protein [Calothrix sp. MO_167.B12]